MPSSALQLQDIITSEDDYHFEQEIMRAPYELKSWWRYIEVKKTESKPNVLNILFERALRALPGSYKLWMAYLQIRQKQIEARYITIYCNMADICRCFTDPAYEAVNKCFERALITMHKFPLVWLEYCRFLMKQKLITRTRKTFNRALQALPITQHDKIWKLYLEFINQKYVPAETGICVYKRYLKYKPEYIEDYIEYLTSREAIDEACVQLVKLVNNEEFVSMYNKSKHDFWMELCRLISKYPDKIKSINAENVIRSGIKKYTTEIGQLWCYLATYFINLGHIEQACNVYEEGISTVATVRDFNLVFSAYAQFMEEIISAKMSAVEEANEEGGEEDLDFTNNDDLEMWMARLEYLMDRRQEMLSSVKLRQNPHNVHEWHKRIRLFHKDPEKVVEIYTTAVKTVDAMKATGKPHTLWVAFAKYYERYFKDVDSARKIFKKATEATFRSADDLATIWCEWVEMELRHGNYVDALKLLQQATRVPKRSRRLDPAAPAQDRLWKSVKLWSLYADVEESVGSFESTRSVYERIIDLKVATPQMIINYADFLEEHKYFEASFRAYEKGVSLFDYPQVYHIWVNYLIKFMERYKGKKLERARDLFEHALEKVPPEFAKNLYLLYAKLEENYGLARHAMNIYDRATKAVKPEEQFEMFNIYIGRAAEYYGITKTREIYEKAIDVLPDKYVKDMCLKYADMERRLGEIDRARAIYVHGANFCDPRVTKDFWDAWYEFEKFHGNPDTAREMLRIKRSVKASFSTTNLMAASMLPHQKELEAKQARDEQLTLQHKRKREETGGDIAELEKAIVKEKNPEEIDLFSAPPTVKPANESKQTIAFTKPTIQPPEEEQEKEDEEINIEQMSVPKTVFERNIKKTE